MRRIVLSLICLLVSPPALAAAPDGAPTPNEVLLLEYINRFRADPPAEAKRVRANPGGHGKDRKVDWGAFEAELAGRAALPPLVFNPKLTQAARHHARYLTVNRKRGHKEQAELGGFTGKKMPERVREVGYDWIAWRENVYVAKTPWDVHAGFVVDYHRRSPDGMLEGRGHREAMLRADVREAGVAEHARESDFLYCQGFGNRKAPKRLAGGVVFVDRDGDGFYTPGEGLGGVEIVASDGATTKTWPSGAYTLELTGRDAVELTARRGGERHTRPFPAGAENIGFGWIIPAP